MASLHLYLGCFLFILSPAKPNPQQLVPHGSQQIYELLNKVIISDQHQPPNTQETSYLITSQLKINSVWNSKKEQLLEVFFSDSSVSAPKQTFGKSITQPISKIPDRPFYISLVEGGRPDKVIAHTSRDQSLLNLERGIASLFQLRYEDGPVTELDVSGKCSTFYHTLSPSKIEKTKTDCSHWDLKVNYRSEKPLSVSQKSIENVKYHLSPHGVLFKAESIETHTLALEAKPSIGTIVRSELVLRHLHAGDETVEQLQYGYLDEAIKSLLEWYRVFDIEGDVDGVLSEIKGTSLKQQVARYSLKLSEENVGKTELALIFAELLPLARITKSMEFVEILEKHPTAHSVLADLFGAVQTIDAHKAVHDYFKLENEAHIELLEKYLQSLAVGTHPERGIIEELFDQLQSKHQQLQQTEKLYESVVQTMSSLTRRSAFDPNDPLLLQIREFIQNQLNTKCEDIDCKLLYIRALQNLQDRQTVNLLLRYALEGDDKISVAAMQALQLFPISNFGSDHRRTFSEIFFQRRRKYDSSARLAALEILLDLKLTKSQLEEILEYLVSNDRQFEVKTYVIQKLRSLATKCTRFRALLTSCLQEKPHVNNYHVLGQKGLTTVLTRQLSLDPAFNESLVSVQEISQGVLKRGSVDLRMSAGSEETSTFKLGIYTSGLSSMVGDVPDDGDEVVDDSAVTAGMEISVQGTLLRPLVFFNGQTELMAHIWRGSASEPTPAYQGTTLVQDHEHYIILASGATVHMRVIGAKSVDLNGKVEFSLWNRNAQTEIQQNTGAVVMGHVVVGFTYAKLENEFILESDPKIWLQANLDFYSGVKLCMQLQRPDLQLNISTNRRVTLQAASKPYSKLVRLNYQHKLPGYTLALNQKNNEMCNMIFPEY